MGLGKGKGSREHRMGSYREGWHYLRLANKIEENMSIRSLNFMQNAPSKYILFSSSAPKLRNSVPDPYDRTIRSFKVFKIEN